MIEPKHALVVQEPVDNLLGSCYNESMLIGSIILTQQATMKGNIMSADKFFTVAGTATNPDGTAKVRFANDLVARIKILNKAGCRDINLVELPKPMNKLQALQYLQELGLTGDAGYAVATKLTEKTKVAKKGEVKISAVKTKAKSTKTVSAREILAAVEQ